MTRIIQLALAGLCAGLLLVIAAELFQLGNQSVAPSVEAVGSKLGVKTLVPALDMEAAVAEILERPLFSPARRPPEITLRCQPRGDCCRKLRRSLTDDWRV